MANHATIIRSLRGQLVFSGLTDSQLEKVAAASSECRLPPGEILFRQGDPALGFYVVLSGAVSLTTSGGRVVETISAGGCFGELEVLDDSVRPATAVTADRVVLVAFDRRDFEVLLAAEPAIVESMMTGLEQRSSSGDEAN